MARLVVLSEYHDIIAASIDQEKLRSSGIKCHVTDDLTQIGLSNTIGGARLMVDESDAEAAAAVLRAHKDAPPPFEDEETEVEKKKPGSKHIFVVQSVFFVISYIVIAFYATLIGLVIWRDTRIFPEAMFYFLSFPSVIVASILLVFTLIYKKHSFSAYFSFTGDLGFWYRLPDPAAVERHLALEAPLLSRFHYRAVNLEFILPGSRGGDFDADCDRVTLDLIKREGFDLEIVQ